MSTTISKISCRSEKDLKACVKQAVDSIGGWKKYVKPGDRVLIKPNVNTGDPFPASSDPQFVRAVVECCFEAGAKEVIVGDSSTMMAKTRKEMEKIKLFDLEKTTKAKVMIFDDGKWIKTKVPQGQYLKSVSLPEILGQVDKVIFVACLKTHFIAKFTASMKLAIGLMKPSERVALHCRKTEEKVAEMCTVVSPDLVLIDARKIFIDQGPTKGTVREPKVILAGTDRLALDIEGIKIIQSFPGNALAGMNIDDLGQIKRAKELDIK